MQLLIGSTALHLIGDDDDMDGICELVAAEFPGVVTQLLLSLCAGRLSYSLRKSNGWMPRR